MSRLLAALVDGKDSAAVSLLDRGLHYGDGIFETIAVASGAPLLWNQHLHRLQGGAASLGITAPVGALLRDWANSLCHAHERAVLKVILTRGIGGRGYRPGPAKPSAALLVYAWPEYPASAQSGVAVRFCDTRLASQPRLAGVKHLNRLEQVLARAEWADEFDEGLMLDQAGNVIEGTMSNLFAVIDNELRTPALDTCGVEGVMRNLVLETASPWILAKTARIRREDLGQASELFLTNSLIGIWPITRLADQLLQVGPVTRRLQNALQSHYVAN